MKKLISILLAMVCMCSPALAMSFNMGREITAAAMSGDLNEVYNQLPRKHVELFGQMAEEAWAAEKARIAERLPELTPAQFYYELRHMLAMADDAHTTVAFGTDQYEYLRALPFAVGWYAGEWRVLMLEDANAQYLGWQLTSINGVPMDEVFERAKSIISHENEYWARGQLSNTINFIDALQYLGIADMDADSVTLHICEGGEEVLLEVPAMDRETIMSADIAAFAPEDPAQTMYIRGYYSAFALDEKTMYVQYNQCAEDPQLQMSEFSDAVLEWMKGAGCDKLVFDLRHNAGGDSRVILPFVEAVQTYQQENGLDVYALIGQGTFSSGTMAMLEAKWRLNAKLVGEPTGGAMACYGDVRQFQLPNMPLIVGYSTQEFVFMEGYEHGQPMCPDVSVEMTFEDYRSGRDPVVEWVMAQ